MKIKLYEDEWYPCYGITEGFGTEVDASEEQIERWTKLMAEFEAAQLEMRAAYRIVEDAERELSRQKDEAERAERQRLGIPEAPVVGVTTLHFTGASVLNADAIWQFTGSGFPK